MRKSSMTEKEEKIQIALGLLKRYDIIQDNRATSVLRRPSISPSKIVARDIVAKSMKEAILIYMERNPVRLWQPYLSAREVK